MGGLIWADGAWRAGFHPYSVTPLQRVVDDLYASPKRTDSATFPQGSGLGAHKGPLAHVPPAFDWAAGAQRTGWWVHDPTHGDEQNRPWTHCQPWLQVLEDATGNPEPRAMLQIEEARLYFLLNGVWERQGPVGPTMEGGYWKPDPYSAVTGDFDRHEQVSGTVDSVALEPLHDPAHPLLHAWWKSYFPRWPIPDTGNLNLPIHISAQLRLRPGAPGVDITRCKFLAGVSLDLYVGPEIQVGYGGYNPAIGIPVHHYLTDRWQHFGYTSNMTEQQLRDNPPPTANRVRDP